MVCLVVVKVRVKACPLREVHEGAYDIGVTQPVVEADGTKHEMVRTTLQHISLEKRIQRDIARGVKGSRRNKKNKLRLKNLQALQQDVGVILRIKYRPRLQEIHPHWCGESKA